MSTFKGIINEFPDITVDFFRLRPGMPLPLACFLSHIHSDHLEGLASFKSPFIYCSPATKELLIRLEPKIQRIWYAYRVTESRKPMYKHLKDVLRAIPLETPTKIELRPGNEIQVTLFDANHCTGAVMFLFEGQGNAVLYTGDIRAEPWWVNNLTRNPFMIEYSSRLKKLDCIYLDTSNTRLLDFPTKASGLGELLQKVSKYPKDTIFHISSWTFGYEEVWMTLSKALNTPIHVDAYKYGLYRSLCGNSAASESGSSKGGPTNSGLSSIAAEASVLMGYKCGNSIIPGCLTQDHTVRLHNCEKGTCRAIDRNENVVWIRPIIARTKDGAELAEVGIGGGGEDLSRELEVEVDDSVDIEDLLKILEAFDDPHAADVKKIIAAGWHADSKRLILNGKGLNIEEGSSTPAELVKSLRQSVIEAKRLAAVERGESQSLGDDLPRIITFPFSRHASYPELCHLVESFQPRDVYPCTVDEIRWDKDHISIRDLFGHFCSGDVFRHEQEMETWRANKPNDLSSQQTHTTTDTQTSKLALRSAEISRALLLDTELENLPIYRASPEARPLSHQGRGIVLTPRGRATPPRQIMAISPNSASQNLRRKAIHDQLRDMEVKRVRRDYDRSPSRLIDESHLQAGPHVGRTTLGFQAVDMIASPEVVEHNAQTLASVELHQSAAATYSDTSEDGIWSDRYIPDEEQFDDEQPVVFDKMDQVFRCLKCGHELWGPRGFCTGEECENKDTNAPYMEVALPGVTLPEISLDDETDALLNREDIKMTVGPVLDYDSSAYDSMDSDLGLNEAYDVTDNFINDSESEDTGSEKDEPSGDEEPDYEGMYSQLKAVHSGLLDDYVNMDDAFRSLRRDVGITDSEDEHEDEEHEDDDDEIYDEEMDEDGLLIVDVKNPDPVVTEIVLSHALEEAQESEITDERIRARATAFEAAERMGGWWDIEMSSTTNHNHTLPEIEL